MATDNHDERLSRIEEEKQVIRLTKLNIELTELLHSHLNFLIRDCEEKGIEFPHLERTIDLMNKTKRIVDEIYPQESSVETKAMPKIEVHPPKRDSPSDTPKMGHNRFVKSSAAEAYLFLSRY